MKKNFKRTIALMLAFCTIITLCISPVSAADPPTDRSDLISVTNASVKQNGVEFDATKPLSSEQPTVVSGSFAVPVLGDLLVNDLPEGPHIKKGDTAKIKIASCFLPPDITTHILKQGDVKIGTLTLSASPDGKVVADILFDGEDEVFAGDIYGVNCSFKITLNYDANGVAGSEGNHNVTILGTPYTVTVPPLHQPQ